jgi:hypothetical protein
VNASAAAAAAEVHSNIFFQLYSLSIKPLAMPVDAGTDPVIANVTIRGWTRPDSHRVQDGTDADADSDPDSDPKIFRVAWTSGYTRPLTIDFSDPQFSPLRWEKLTSVDFAVDYGPDGLDWEFCLDDLVVAVMMDEGRMGAHGQEIL